MNPQRIPAGAACWIDLMTSDSKKSRDFYTALFGWSYAVGDEEKYAGYTMAFKDGKSVAGIMQSTENGNGHPDLWTTYLGVDSIATSIEAAKNAGAIVYLQPVDVPDQGKMAMVGDPGGASIGLWEFGAHTGFQAHEEDGAAAWHELYTKDYAAAVQFYGDVFGSQSAVMSDTPEFRYTNLVDGEKELAGIMDAAAFLPHETPSSWHVYFQTDDVDATIEGHRLGCHHRQRRRGFSLRQDRRPDRLHRCAVQAGPAAVVGARLQRLRSRNCEYFLGAGRDQTCLIGQDHGLYPVPQAKFRQNFTHMCLDCLLRDEQLNSNLLVREAPANEPHDF